MDADPFVPTDFPIVIYFPDGFPAIAQTAEDLAGMSQAYGRSPDGPFRGVDLATLPWDLSYAPFGAGLATGWPFVSTVVPRGHRFLFSPEHRIHGRRVYWKGLLLPHSITLEQRKLHLAGYLWEVQEGDLLVQYHGFMFVDEDSRNEFVSMREARARTGMVWTDFPPLDMAPNRHIGMPPGYQASEQSATVAPQDISPQSPPAKKPAHNRIPPRSMNIFKKHLIKTVLEHVGKHGKDDIPLQGRIHSDFPVDLTDSKWRTRCNRTREDWRCKNWEAVFLLIINTNEKLGNTNEEEILLCIMNTNT